MISDERTTLHDVASCAGSVGTMRALLEGCGSKLLVDGSMESNTETPEYDTVSGRAGRAILRDA
jgi:hypothetical protein